MESVKHNLRNAAREIGISLTKLKTEIRRKNIGVEVLGPRTKRIYQAECDAYKRRRQKNFRVII